MYQVSYKSLVYFQRYAPDKLSIANIKNGSNSINTVGRITILALCTFTDDLVSMSQILFHSRVYFQRYTPDKVFIAKINKSTACGCQRSAVAAFRKFLVEKGA